MKHLLLIITTFFIINFPFSNAHASDPRFIDWNNGTIYDTVSNLIWLKNANCFGYQNWGGAMSKSNTLTDGQCDLSDGSKAGDWHLPTIYELIIFVDAGYRVDTLNAAGFTSVESYAYWSGSTTYADNARYVSMANADNRDASKSNGYCVWPVRPGQFWSFDSLILYVATSEYGNVQVGTTGASQQIRLQNNSAAPVTITATTLTGANPTEFTVVLGGSNACSSLTPVLAAGTHCTLAVAAAPTSSGAKAANLTITTASGSKDIPLNAAAFTTIYGTVTDQSTGRPVSGATLTFNTSTTATTDTNGTYNFGNLPPATYSITISKTGYQTTTKNVLVVSATASAMADILLPTVGALSITSTTLPWASPNVAYSNRIMVAGGTAPYTFSKPTGTLPTGLSLDTTTGIISGTPTGTGSYPFAIGVTDSVSGYSEKEFTIDLLPPLEISTLSLPSGQQGVAYSSTIAGNGGKTAYSFTISSGTLPSGLTLATTGVLSGIPREPGTFNITVRLTDATGRTYDKSYSLTLTAAAALSLNTTTLAQGYVGTYYTATLSASGGVPGRTFSVAGTLPAGLTLNSTTGVISGTPSAAGLANYAFTVTDYSYPTAQTASVTLPLRIWNALSIATTSIPAGTQKSAYSTTLSGIGGVTPHTWSIATGTLPQGLTIDGASGVIAGTPTNCGAFPITTRLTDSAATPKSIDKALTLTVACSNDYIISGNAGVAGTTVTYSGTASGTVTADGSGNYSIGPLLNGTYIVTPSKALYLFTPPSRSATVNNLDLSVVAFVGALDVTAPTVTGFVIPATATTLNVVVTTFTATDNAAVTGYLLTETATTPAATASNWSVTIPTNYAFVGIPDGVATPKTLYAWAKDAAGNISSSATASTTITLPDVTAPTVITFTIPTSSQLTVPVTTFTATDNVTVSGYCISETNSSTSCSWSTTAPTSYTFTTAGNKTLYAWAKDSAGNISLPVSATVNVTSKAGDCDSSGTVTIAEVQSAINMFLGLKTVEACVDIDNNSNVSIAEVQKVINSFLGL